MLENLNSGVWTFRFLIRYFSLTIISSIYCASCHSYRHIDILYFRMQYFVNVIDATERFLLDWEGWLNFLHSEALCEYIWWWNRSTFILAKWNSRFTTEPEWFLSFLYKLYILIKEPCIDCVPGKLNDINYIV